MLQLASRCFLVCFLCTDPCVFPLAHWERGMGDAVWGESMELQWAGRGQIMQSWHTERNLIVLVSFHITFPWQLTIGNSVPMFHLIIVSSHSGTHLSWFFVIRKYRLRKCAELFRIWVYGVAHLDTEKWSTFLTRILTALVAVHWPKPSLLILKASENRGFLRNYQPWRMSLSSDSLRDLNYALI